MIQEPVQPVINGPSGPPSPRRRGGLRMALLIAAGLALAVPVVAFTAAQRPQAPTVAAGAEASPEASAKVKGPKKDKDFKVNNGNGNGNGGGRLKGLGSPRGADHDPGDQRIAGLTRDRGWLESHDRGHPRHGHHQGRPADRGRRPARRRSDPLQPDAQRRWLVHDQRDRRPDADHGWRGHGRRRVDHHRQGQGLRDQGHHGHRRDRLSARQGSRVEGGRQGRRQGRGPGDGER